MKRCQNCRQHPQSHGGGTDGLCCLCWPERPTPENPEGGPRFNYPYHHQPLPHKTAITYCEQYRYLLWRDMPGDIFFSQRNIQKAGFVLFIGLNPSKADATKDDATIRRMKDFAVRWGYGSLAVINLFAFRATKPTDMMAAADPVGYLTDIYRDKAIKEAALIVCCWGAGGNFRDGGKLMMEAIKKARRGAWCFGKNKDGSPKHPVRLAKVTPLQIYDQQGI